MAFANPILDDSTLNRAVTDLFKQRLKEHLLEESKAIVDKTVEDLSKDIEMFTKAYINHGLNSFQPEYNVNVVVKDSRNDVRN